MASFQLILFWMIIMLCVSSIFLHACERSSTSSQFSGSSSCLMHLITCPFTGFHVSYLGGGWPKSLNFIPPHTSTLLLGLKKLRIGLPSTLLHPFYWHSDPIFNPLGLWHLVSSNFKQKKSGLLLYVPNVIRYVLRISAKRWRMQVDDPPCVCNLAGLCTVPN